MKMEQAECPETSTYKISDAGELPRRKHTTLSVLCETRRKQAEARPGRYGILLRRRSRVGRIPWRVFAT